VGRLCFLLLLLLLGWLLMAADWVPFHRALTRGTKLDLSRATRFIYLQLALEARQTDGKIRLPAALGSDVDAVHDLVRGDRKEVVAALKALLVPLTGETEPMLAFETERGCRTLVVVAFHEWAKAVDTSTARVKKHRDAKRLVVVAVAETAAHDQKQQVTHVSCETPCNVSSCVSVTAQIREEENRKEETPKPPQGVELENSKISYHGTNATQDGAMGLTVAAWSEGIRSVTGAKAGPLPRGGALRALLDALDRQRPDREDEVSWARRAAVAYARANAGKALSEHFFASWLSSGGQVPAERTSAPVRAAVQAESEPPPTPEQLAAQKAQIAATRELLSKAPCFIRLPERTVT
jgi:hypothetical protein